MEHLLRSFEAIHVHRPDLCDLAGQTGCQVGQVSWDLAIISNPHEVSIDKNREVVALLMCLTSMTDEDCWNKLRG